MAGHSEGALVGEFCTQRKSKCDKHGEQYRAVNCGVVPWEFQAHHVLCVASVTQYLSADTKITSIVELTAWCINRKDNMLAMPTYMGTVYKMLAAWALTGAPGKPPFADIPVHGYDHNSKKGYKKEIDTEMMNMATRAQRSKAKHEVTSGTLLGELNAYQGRMKPALKARGERGAGTYNEWLMVYSGQKKPDSDWYIPFSMANKGCIEARTYPLGRVKAIVEKVKELVAALI